MHGTGPDAEAATDHEAPTRVRRPPGFLGKIHTFDALRFRDFRLLWLGQGSISMSTWMDQVSRGWLTYELTGSAFQLGLVKGVRAIPFLLLSPIAGTAADRYDRKMQLAIAQIGDVVMYGAIAVLILTGLIQPWHVYLTAFGSAVVGVFQQPARLAMTSDVVPRETMTNAIGLNSILFNVARMTGPAMAGLLIAYMGTASAFIAQCAFYSIATVWTISLPDSLRLAPGATSQRSRSQSFGQSTLEGWQAAWANTSVRAGLTISFAASFFIIPFTTLLPVFASDVLSAGATGQGFLLAAMGVGALGSAILIASLGDQLPRGWLMLGGVTFYGSAVVAFSQSPWLPLSEAIMVLVGLFHVSSQALVQTVIQTYAEPEVRGRTMAVFQQNRVVQMAGSLLMGALATALSAQWAVAIMGTAGAFSAILIFLMMPAARRVR